MGAAVDITKQLWWKRASLPAYPVGRAAQLVHLHPTTLARWQNLAYVIPKRERGNGFSYLQLIEAAVVAQMRSVPIKLADIRAARAFVAEKIGSPYPFATHKFKTDGVDLLMEFDDVFDGDKTEKTVVANRGGQLAWSPMFMETIKTFEYDGNVVVRWKVAGANSPIIIDPRVAFGETTVQGVPTGAVFERWSAGEDAAELAEDYGIGRALIRKAIQFEGRLRDQAFEGDFD